MAGTQEVKSWGDFLVTGIVMAVIGLLMIIFQAGEEMTKDILEGED